MASGSEAVAGGRGRGRPVGSDSAETRSAILRAARQVINERGYEAATFQAIAVRAGFSRPTMHYYFHTKEDIFETLQREAHAVVVDCIAAAQREESLLKQLSTFVVAARRFDLADGSMMRFIVTSRFEQHRCPSLRGTSTPISAAVADFYAKVVDDAIARGELPADTDAKPVVDLLYAMFWGMGFFAGFVHAPDDLLDIAKQLQRVFRKGLLNVSGVGTFRPVPLVDDRPAAGRPPMRPLRAVAFGA